MRYTLSAQERDDLSGCLVGRMAGLQVWSGEGRTLPDITKDPRFIRAGDGGTPLG